MEITKEERKEHALNFFRRMRRGYWLRRKKQGKERMGEQRGKQKNGKNKLIIRKHQHMHEQKRGGGEETQWRKSNKKRKTALKGGGWSEYDLYQTEKKEKVNKGKPVGQHEERNRGKKRRRGKGLCFREIGQKENNGTREEDKKGKIRGPTVSRKKIGNAGGKK